MHREPLPTISVLMALYNKEDHVASTLTSIDRQLTASKFLIELVVVDDGSSDRSWDIVARFEWTNSAVRVVMSKTERNLGPGGAYAQAQRASSGSLIVPLDADDLITRISLLQRFEAFAADRDLEWVTANGLIIDADGAIKPGRELVKPESVAWDTAVDGTAEERAARFVRGELFFAIQTLMLRRDVMDSIGWYEEMRCCQDTSLIFALLLDGRKHRHLRDYVALYRQHIHTAPTRSVFGQSLMSGQALADIESLRRRFAARLTPALQLAFDHTLQALERHPLYEKGAMPHAR